MVTKKIIELSGEDALLVKKAQEATELSYAPYSNFHVGAAVLLANGEIIKGANQENVSYPCGICAERSTLATAQNFYPNVPILAIALAAKNNDELVKEPVTPCGMCRQVIAETENRYNTPIRIIMSSDKNAILAENAKEILPLAFSDF